MNHALIAWARGRRVSITAPLLLLFLLGSFGLPACSATPEAADDDNNSEDHAVAGNTPSSDLKPSDLVSRAIESSCATEVVRGLSTQLVSEIQCVRPDTLESLEGVDGITLGSSAFPFLQAPAAKALREAAHARGSAMMVNSALRTLPQQFLLYSWHTKGRCNIPLAAAPGKSNHESGLAVDIDDNAGWQESMTEHDFKWFGERDHVHFDFIGTDAVDLGGLSVRAFQRLWNRNHPEDHIEEDGKYGAQTEKRLAQAPVGGFEKGADCAARDDRSSP